MLRLSGWKVVICAGFILLFGIVVSVPGVYGDTSKDKRSRLQSILQLLKLKRSEQEKLEGQERNIKAELEKLDRQLQEYLQELEQQTQALSQQKQELNQLEKNLARLQEGCQQKKGLLAKRLRAIYKMGTLGYLTPLFVISSSDNMQQQIKYLQLIAKTDRQLIHETEQDMQSIREQQEEVEQRKQEIMQTQKTIKQQQAEITAQKKEKAVLLARLRKDTERYAQEIQKLENSAQQLEQLIVDLDEQERKAIEVQRTQPGRKQGQDVTFPSDLEKRMQSYAKHFRANKGKLIWPVEGKIITQFGPIRIGDTYTHYNGVDIQATRGTPFYSVFKGTVKYADWFKDYGKLIIVDHGGSFYTLYAHADELAVKSGDTVETRQFLGNVGSTDSIKGSHLYFEVRVKGKPDNPQHWLAR